MSVCLFLLHFTDTHAYIVAGSGFLQQELVLSRRLTVVVIECQHVVLCTTDNHSCPVDQFKCPTNRCIPKRWLCDGADDCGDNEDESNSTCSGKLVFPDSFSFLFSSSFFFFFLLSSLSSIGATAQINFFLFFLY